MASKKGMTVETYHKGQLIIKEGQDSTHTYLIKSGSVIIFKLVNNKRVIISSLGKGEIFGEMGALTGKKRNANAMAADFTELIVIEKVAVEAALKSSPPLISNITKLLIDRLMKASASLFGQSANDDVSGSQSNSSLFLNICSILDILAKGYMDGKNADKSAGNKISIPMTYLYEKLKDMYALTQLEIDSVIKKIEKFQLIELNKERGIQWLIIKDPENLIKVAKHLHEEWQKQNPQAGIEFEYVDIQDFAKIMNTTPEIIYKKIGYGEIPENLFFLHKDESLAWAKEVGESFFQKAKKKRFKPEDFYSINDIVHIDTGTLQQAFSNIGLYKLSILVAISNEETRGKIYSCLSEKNKKVIEEENAVERDIDEVEADEIEEEFILLVKKLKGWAM